MSFNITSNQVERWVARWHDLVLLLVYLLVHLPGVLLVRSANAIQYPLEAIYISRTMFDGLGLSRELASSAVTPSNVGLFYGPLNYLLSLWLGTVQHLFWFNFAIQILVPLFAYRLLSTVTSRLNAFLIAAFLVAVCVQVQWWSPDFLVQPLLLAALYLWSKSDDQAGTGRIITLGLLVAVIAALKYHEGLILMTAIGGGLMLRLAVSDVPRGIYNSADTLIVALCFATVAAIFAGHFLFVDEWLYYALPNIALVFCVYYILSKHGASVLTNPRTLRILLTYVTAALSLPVLSFTMFGGEFGYSKYYYATFQMGLDYLPVWDFGIVGLVRDHLWGALRSSPLGVAKITFVSLLIASPLAVNIVVVAKLAKIVSTAAMSFAAKREAVAVGSISVLGIYMLYPLEGYHILVSKLGLFSFSLLYFAGHVPSVKKTLSIALIGLLIPILGLQTAKWWELRDLGSNDLTPPVEIKGVVGISLSKPLLKELARQVETIRANVPAGCSYYVVDSSGGGLIGLAALVPNGIRQTYIEMRPGLLDRAAVDLIGNELGSIDFVVLRKKDMDDYVSGATRNTKIAPILSRLRDDFAIVATYIRGGNEKGTEGLVDFLVLRRAYPHAACSVKAADIGTAKATETQK